MFEIIAQIAENEVDVFSIEYANSNYKEYYSVLDMYAKMKGKDDKEDIDTNQYFRIFDFDQENNNGEVLFDRNEFEEARKKTIEQALKQKNEKDISKLNGTFQVILLKKLSFFKFIQQKEIQEMVNSNVYIRSKETGEFIRQAYSFQEISNIGKNM